MLRHPLVPLLLGAALIGVSVSAAAAYRWTDSAGNVHFSQEAPANGRAQEVPMPSAPMVGDTPPTMPANAKKNGRRPAAGTRKPGHADAGQRAATRKKNCRIARNNLRVYQQAPRIRDAKGNLIGLTGKQRQARIKETKKLVEKFCK